MKKSLMIFVGLLIIFSIFFTSQGFWTKSVSAACVLPASCGMEVCCGEIVNGECDGDVADRICECFGEGRYDYIVTDCPSIAGGGIGAPTPTRTSATGKGAVATDRALLRGWISLSAADGSGNCYRKAESSRGDGRGLRRILRR